MAQKRKTDQTKLTGRSGPKMNTGALARLKALLEKIEEKTARGVKGHLGKNWRDNLFEVMMTRVELATPHRKFLSGVPAAFRKQPDAIPEFACIFWKTMKNILKLARAPARPHHVAAFGVLYVSVVDTFLKDETPDHAKTMAALDKRLGLFEQVVELRCRGL